jgi:Rieske Fe-S protein
MAQRVSPEAGGVDASRRALLVMGTAGAVTLVSGCTVYGRTPAPPAAEPTRPASDEGGKVGGDERGDERGEEGGGAAVARAADVPPGGGLIVGDLVITQPASGEFRGFTTTCTHQGCAVTSVSEGTINCPCHGSRFSIEDGTVVRAAAGLTPQQQSPLPAVAIRVDGDTITRP